MIRKSVLEPVERSAAAYEHALKMLELSVRNDLVTELPGGFLDAGTLTRPRALIGKSNWG
jgi:hypothetical protein